MTKDEISYYVSEIATSKWNYKQLALALLKRLEEGGIADVVEEPKGTYTTQQRRAAWLYIDQRITALNDAGLDQRKFLKPGIDIPWTKDAFHDLVWIPVQKALFRTESMRELKKDQPGKIHEVLEREIGEKHGLDYIPFPSDDARALEQLTGPKLNAGSDYDPALGLEDYQGPVNFDQP